MAVRFVAHPWREQANNRGARNDADTSHQELSIRLWQCECKMLWERNPFLYQLLELQILARVILIQMELNFFFVVTVFWKGNEFTSSSTHFIMVFADVIFPFFFRNIRNIRFIYVFSIPRKSFKSAKASFLDLTTLRTFTSIPLSHTDIINFEWNPTQFIKQSSLWWWCDLEFSVNTLVLF